MRRHGTQCKTYGRASVLSQDQVVDFDKVFKNVTDGNGTDNSPFGTSDSSAGRSGDLCVPNKRYNFRKNDLCNDVYDSVSTDSSFAQDSMTTPLQKGSKHASQRARKVRGVKKISTRQTKRLNLSEKENIFNKDIPDYDAIAEDSFVVESENKNNVRVAKCSTPVANSVDSFDLGDNSEKMPTPIFHVLRSSKVCDVAHSDCVTGIEIDSFDDSINVTTRRPYKLRDNVLKRKILVDKDCVSNKNRTSISPQHNFLLDTDTSHDDESLNCVKSVHEQSSVLYSNVTDDSVDNLLKSIGENFSKVVSINLSLDAEEMNKVSPSQDVPSSSFDISDDLFESHKDSNLEGLSCIREENEEFKSSLKESFAQDVDSVAADHKSSITESFYDKLVTISICENETHTAEEKLMAICEQDKLISFSACIPSSMMSKCVKIGEGVYGEVFRSVSRDDQNVAIKIIPMEGNFNVNDCPQKTFDEILPEAVIAKELSDLADGSYNLNFCQVNRIACVQGSFPAPLLKQWDAYAQRKLSENDRPDFFPKSQLFAVFEFVDGGIALENFEVSNHRQALSILRQVVYALAVAESSIEFEHRDLHIGNILVRPYKETAVKFKFEGEEFEFASEGVLATIIDFTISRLKKDGCAVFCDVSTDEGLFEGTGDFQFDVYRDMRNANNNDWSQFCPYSNVLWVQYLCKKLMTVIKIKDKGRDHRDCQRHLRQMNECILNYESCLHMALDPSLWEF